MKKTLIAFAVGFASMLSPQAVSFDVWFDDEATLELSDYPNALDGRYKPSTPLSAFDGEATAQDWFLFVSDLGFVSANSVLIRWELEIEGSSGNQTQFIETTGIITDGVGELFALQSTAFGSILDVNVRLRIDGLDQSDISPLVYFNNGVDDFGSVLFDYGNLSPVPDALPGVVPAISLLSVVAADAMRRRFKK